MTQPSLPPTPPPPPVVLIEAVCGACLLEIFAQSWPGIKSFSSGIQRKQRPDPLHVPPRGTTGWRLLLCGDPSGSLCVRVDHICIMLHV